MNGKRTYPTIYRKIPRFFKSLYKHILDMFRHVKKTEAKRRMDICKECPFFNSKNSTCNNCGCYLPMKTKWKSEHCPIEKW